MIPNDVIIVVSLGAVRILHAVEYSTWSLVSHPLEPQKSFSQSEVNGVFNLGFHDRMAVFWKVRLQR